MFELAPGSTGFTRSGDGDVANPHVVQVGLDRGVPVAAVSGHRVGTRPILSVMRAIAGAS